MYPSALQVGAQFGQGTPAGVDPGVWENFQKAVTAGYGSDSASLVGGGSLRIESLEHTLMSVVQSNQHFKLFNRLKKSPATATVDEWTEHDDVDIRSFINASNSRATTERPILNAPWSLTFSIQVTDDSLPEGTLKAMYEVAGLRCGLGVYGPTFGRFAVKEWKAI